MDQYTRDKVNQIKSMINRLTARQIEIRKLCQKSSNEREINRLRDEKMGNRNVIRILNELKMIILGMDYESRIKIDKDYPYFHHYTRTVYIFEAAQEIIGAQIEEPSNHWNWRGLDYEWRGLTNRIVFSILIGTLFPKEEGGIFGQTQESIQNDIMRDYIDKTLKDDHTKYWNSKGWYKPKNS